MKKAEIWGHWHNGQQGETAGISSQEKPRSPGSSTARLAKGQQLLPGYVLPETIPIATPAKAEAM